MLGLPLSFPEEWQQQRVCGAAPCEAGHGRAAASTDLPAFTGLPANHQPAAPHLDVALRPSYWAKAGACHQGPGPCMLQHKQLLTLGDKYSAREKREGHRAGGSQNGPLTSLPSAPAADTDTGPKQP